MITFMNVAFKLHQMYLDTPDKLGNKVTFSGILNFFPRICFANNSQTLLGAPQVDFRASCCETCPFTAAKLLRGHTWCDAKLLSAPQ